MLQDLTIPEITTRLQRIEEDVNKMKLHFPRQSESEGFFEFIIQVDGVDVWHGVEVDIYFPQIRQEHPDANISISWRSTPFVMI